jgi:hypothetical protein
MNEKEKNASIEYILSQGLIKPQKARERIVEMINAVGFRHIFWDTGYSLFFAAVTVAAVLVLYALSPYQYRYSTSVAVAPLMFLLITAFTETTERVSGLYELKQTCRYTVRQITALRVLCYGGVGAVFTAVIAVIGASDAYEFLSLFPLCLSSLFVCAALSMMAFRFVRGKWASAAYSVIWVIFSAEFSLLYRDKWELFLSGFPIAVSTVIALAGIRLFAWQISRMLSEVKKYAVA